jgi:DNA polymerase I-like protein with 3'-5' exonuclease and polymerase domains
MFNAATEWVRPETFPDLKEHKYIAIDLETRDPNLKSKGSGALVNEGEIIGVAVAVDGWSGYFPIAHREGNLPKQKVLDWLQEICNLPSTKLFHNAMYDMCWLKAYNINVNGHIIDTMVMAALVNENRFSYSLNSLCYDLLGEVKDESVLLQAAKGIDPKAEMYKLPAMFVGSYAEKDAELTLKLFKHLSLEIRKDKLTEVFDLETRLFPCLIDMKVKGVRVDVERAHILKTKLSGKEEQLLLKVKKETGEDVQIWAARSIGKVFDKLSLPYNRTAKTQAPSFTKNFLQVHKHPLVQCIAKAREINKAHTTFIDTIIKYQYRGRIHADINPVRGEKGGTVTGRFSYSNPNLQQVPARNKDLGPMIRSLFLPERNHTWGCFDYSQQEPRLVVHYAAASPKLREDEEVKDIVSRFNKDNVDFHQTVADMAGIERIQAKTINLGLFYGMGKAKLQAELGLSTKEEAEKLFDKYHSRVPFVKDLMNNTSKDSQIQGYITTLLGRKCRFNSWEVNEYNPGILTPAMTKAEAESESLSKQAEEVKKRNEYKLELKEITEEEVEKEIEKLRPRIRRAFTYKALNKLIQGSAADMTKKAMLDLYEEKIIPHIQIHDELDISVEKGSNQHKKIIEIMEKAVKLNVPNKVDYESGENWGDIYD